MTEQDWIELGRRAVACKGWRWMPGMLCIPIGGGFPLRYNGIVAPNMPDAGGVQYRPDFRDPATLGCLLALVREAYDLPRLALVCCDGRWRVISAGLDVRFPIRAPAKNNTQAAALVAALEAAGGQ